MPKIVVSALSIVPDMIEEHGATRVLGLLGPDMDHPDLTAYRHVNHKPVTMHDISVPMPGMILPGEKHVGEIIEFIEGWDRTKPFLIHCFAGISRSTASAFIAMCLFKPDMPELDIAKQLRDVSDTATPNRLIVEHADRMMDRNGRMLEAVKAIGRGQDYRENISFEWALGG